MPRRKLRKARPGFDNRKETDKVRSELVVRSALKSGSGSHGDAKKYKRHPKHKNSTEPTS